MAEIGIHNSLQNIGTRSKDVPGCNSELGSKLSPSCRQLLESYSKIPASEVESHVHAIRDEGLQRYACIGSFRFLDLALSLDPSYSTILARLKSGETFLDLGCCTGQEVRKLVVDGAPSENLYGSDLFPEFFDLGYKLFGDKETLKSTFIAADIFDSESGLKNLDGKVDIIFAGSFLHLFGLAAQKEACRRIVKLLRAKEGSVFLGKQLGNMKAGVHRHRRNPGQTSWAHDEESFRRMWKEVGEETGSEWKVDFTYLDPAVEDIRMRGNAYGEGLRRIQFKVFRV